MILFIKVMSVKPIIESLHHENNKLPKHVALIMDGNGRWATKKGMPRLYGHQQGVEALKVAADYALEIGIPYLSAWAFSTANWKRPKAEVSGLMKLLKQTFSKEIKSLHEKGIRILVIGLRDGIGPDVLETIDKAMQLTRDNTKLTLVIQFNYDGRTDILQATKHIAAHVQSGVIKVEDITETLFSQYLLSQSLPDPDLLIRTSGLMRLSNFMMWQCASTELLFLEKNWPDFTKQDFEAAIHYFQSIERKFGQVTAK